MPMSGAVLGTLERRLSLLAPCKQGGYCPGKPGGEDAPCGDKRSRP